MKLISMGEFAFEESLKKQSPYNFWKKAEQYACFLKTPLKLSMFIACDDEGEILIYEDLIESVKQGTETLGIWEKGINNVLFKGFHVIDKGDFYFIEKDRLYLRILKNNTKTTIEDLLIWGNINIKTYKL